MPDQPFHWSLTELPDQHGRRVVVTGASSGLGAVVARELAGAGAEVIMAVRDGAKGERVATAIRQRYPQAHLAVSRIDLAELDSVRAFDRALLDEGRPIDVLVLNAGVAGGGYAATSDGIERTFAANVVGHFAMAHELLPLLEPATDPRIVAVGSNFYRRVRVDLDPDDLAFPDPVSNLAGYVRSKLANLLVASELDRRLRVDGSPVRSMIAHPGVAATSLNDTTQRATERLVGKLVTRLIARTADEGALPLIFAATAPQAPTGQFIGRHLRRSDKHIWADDIVGPGLDRDLAARLWQRLESVTTLAPNR